MKKGTIIGVVVGIIVAIILAIVLVIGFGGNGDNQQEESTKKDVFEIIKLIEPESTVEEINEIIGFEGKCTDEEGKVYKWEVSGETSVRVQYSDNNEATIEISFPGKLIANDKVDFSKFNEIKAAMNTKDSITYDEIVEKLGGVQGTLKYKTTGTLRYEWDRPDGGYLTCTFNSSTMKCTFASGRV